MTVGSIRPVDLVDTEHRQPGVVDAVVYLVGVVGAVASLAIIFLSMRAVMDVGGFCAEGGPYQIQTPCPDGIALLLPLAIFGLIGSGAVVAAKGTTLGPPYAALVGLLWPGLFLSLGWNFLQYGVFDATDGVVWGWLIPGVLFVLMGLGPLALGSPFGHTGRMGSARNSLAGHVGPRPGDSGWTIWPGETPATATADLVSQLERLARLHQSGALDDHEYQRAKQVLLDRTQS